MQYSYKNSEPDALERIFQGPLNWVNLLFVGLNIVIFVILEIQGDTEDVQFMLNRGAAYTPYILDGEYYRLFTSMFLHFGLPHLFNNMFLLLILGDMLEGIVGKWRYLLIYLGGGLAGNLLSLYMDIRSGDMVVSAGASGAVYAVIGGIIVLLIANRGRVRGISVQRVIFAVVLMLYYGSQAEGIDNMAHIGGIAAGIVLTFLCCMTGKLRYR